MAENDRVIPWIDAGELDVSIPDSETSRPPLLLFKEVSRAVEGRGDEMPQPNRLSAIGINHTYEGRAEERRIFNIYI
jgi:hypothetical protein